MQIYLLYSHPTDESTILWLNNVFYISLKPLNTIYYNISTWSKLSPIVITSVSNSFSDSLFCLLISFFWTGWRTSAIQTKRVLKCIVCLLHALYLFAQWILCVPDLQTLTQCYRHPCLVNRLANSVPPHMKVHFWCIRSIRLFWHWHNSSVNQPNITCTIKTTPYN